MKTRYWVLLFLLAAACMYAGIGQKPGNGSIYSYKPDGARAFFLVLDRLGKAPLAWRYPFSQLARQYPVNTTLFVVKPSRFAGVEKLKQWVAAGNQLVYMGDWDMDLWSAFSQDFGSEKLLCPGGCEDGEKEKKRKSRPIANALNALVKEGKGIRVRCPRRLNEGACRSVDQISWIPPLFYAPSGAKTAAYSEAEPAIAVARVGNGKAWFFAHHLPLTNDYITKFDNFRLLYQIAVRHPNILFDEFHHGYTAPLSRAAAGRMDSLIACAVFIGLFMVIVAATRLPRFGPPQHIAAEGTSSSEEFASVLGLLYGEHQAHTVLTHYIDGWRRRLERVYGVSHRASAEAMIEKLQAQKRIKPERAEMVLRAIRTIAHSPKSKPSPEVLAKSVAELESVVQPQDQGAG